MIFHNYQRDVNHFIHEIRINGQLVERVTEFNFLGLTIDEHLNWKSHIQKVSNKVSRSIGVLNRLKKFLPLTVLIILYNALILPHFQFSILAWGFNPGRLNKLQKRAIMVITNTKYNALVEPLLKMLNLLRLTDIYKINLLKLFYKFKNYQLPHCLKTVLSDADKLHAYNTRSNTVLTTPRSNLYGTEKCVRHHLPHLINDTDRNIIEKVDTHSYNGFGAYVKKTNYPRLSIRMQLINLLCLSKTRALILFSMKLVNYLLTFFQPIWHSVIGTLWWHITALSRYFAVILCQSLKWTPRVSPHKQATGCPCPFRHLWFQSWPLCGIYSYRPSRYVQSYWTAWYRGWTNLIRS